METLLIALAALTHAFSKRSMAFRAAASCFYSAWSLGPVFSFNSSTSGKLVAAQTSGVDGCGPLNRAV